MNVIFGLFGSRFGIRFPGIVAHVSLAMGMALSLLLIPGTVAAEGQDEFTAPIALEEGRSAPPGVLEDTSDAPERLQRQVRGNSDVGIKQTSKTLVGNNEKSDAGTLGFNRDRGQPFTTGSNTHGYKLTSVQIASNVTVIIYLTHVFVGDMITLWT